NRFDCQTDSRSGNDNGQRIADRQPGLKPNGSVCAIGETDGKSGKSRFIQGAGEKGAPGIVGGNSHGENSRYGIQGWRSREVWVRHVVEGNPSVWHRPGAFFVTSDRRPIDAPNESLRLTVKNRKQRER